MKMKFPIFSFFACLVSFTAAAGPPSPVPAMKPETTVSSDLVRIGDLIENAGPAAAIPVFRAPELGATGTIQTHRVLEAVRANGIALLDTRGVNEVVVIRASRTISLGELERAIAEAAASQRGLRNAKDITVSFDRDARPLQIEANAKDTPRVVQFSHDPRTQRFDAIVEVAGSAILRRKPVRITGTLTETAEVITLARTFARGEIMRESDLMSERRPRSEIATDTITQPEAVIGLAARKSLRTGQTLRPADLMKPDLVGRNDAVTILFKTHGITLTLRGKALASGAEGEMVPVLNPQSKRVVQAMVEAPGLVVIGRSQAAASDVTSAMK